MKVSPKGNDNEHVDVFVGPHLESELVFVVNQCRENGDFDEHKSLIGFRNKKEAKQAYLDCYKTGWNGCGSIVELTLPQFKRWLAEADTSKPIKASAKLITLATARQMVEDQSQQQTDPNVLLLAYLDALVDAESGDPHADQIADHLWHQLGGQGHHPEEQQTTMSTSSRPTMVCTNAEACDDNRGHGRFFCQCGKLMRQCRCSGPDHKDYYLTDKKCGHCDTTMSTRWGAMLASSSGQWVKLQQGQPSPLSGRPIRSSNAYYNASANRIEYRQQPPAGGNQQQPSQSNQPVHPSRAHDIAGAAGMFGPKQPPPTVEPPVAAKVQQYKPGMEPPQNKTQQIAHPLDLPPEEQDRGPRLDKDQLLERQNAGEDIHPADLPNKVLLSIRDPKAPKPSQTEYQKLLGMVGGFSKQRLVQFRNLVLQNHPNPEVQGGKMEAMANALRAKIKESITGGKQLHELVPEASEASLDNEMRQHDRASKAYESAKGTPEEGTAFDKLQEANKRLEGATAHHEHRSQDPYAAPAEKISREKVDLFHKRQLAAVQAVREAKGTEREPAALAELRKANEAFITITRAHQEQQEGQAPSYIHSGRKMRDPAFNSERFHGFDDNTLKKTASDETADLGLRREAQKELRRRNGETEPAEPINPNVDSRKRLSDTHPPLSPGVEGTPRGKQNGQQSQQPAEPNHENVWRPAGKTHEGEQLWEHGQTGQMSVGNPGRHEGKPELDEWHEIGTHKNGTPIWKNSRTGQMRRAPNSPDLFSQPKPADTPADQPPEDGHEALPKRTYAIEHYLAHGGDSKTLSKLKAAVGPLGGKIKDHIQAVHDEALRLGQANPELSPKEAYDQALAAHAKEVASGKFRPGEQRTPAYNPANRPKDNLIAAPEHAPPKSNAGHLAGKETKIRAPGFDKPIPARYEVRELADINASHSYHTGVPLSNTNYPPELQPRDYKLHSQEDYKVRKFVDKESRDPNYFLSNDPTAANGPPTITEDGTVINGNARQMALQLAAHQGDYEWYKKALLEDAQRFGVDPKQVEGMKHPVLVRSVAMKGTDKEAHAFARAGNVSNTESQSPVRTAASHQGMIRPTIFDALDLSGDETFSEAVKQSGGKDFREKLRDALPSQEVSRYFTPEGQLTDSGTELVRSMMLTKILPVGLVESMGADQKDLKRSIEGALPQLIKFESDPDKKFREKGKALNSALQEAIEFRHRAKARGDAISKPGDVDHLLSQQSIEGTPFEQISPEGRIMLDFLNQDGGKPREFKQKLGKLLGVMQDSAGVFGGETDLASEAADALGVQKRDGATFSQKIAHNDSVAASIPDEAAAHKQIDEIAAKMGIPHEEAAKKIDQHLAAIEPRSDQAETSAQEAFDQEIENAKQHEGARGNIAEAVRKGQELAAREVGEGQDSAGKGTPPASDGAKNGAEASGGAEPTKPVTSENESHDDHFNPEQVTPVSAKFMDRVKTAWNKLPASVRESLNERGMKLRLGKKMTDLYSSEDDQLPISGSFSRNIGGLHNSGVGKNNLNLAERTGDGEDETDTQELEHILYHEAGHALDQATNIADTPAMRQAHRKDVEAILAAQKGGDEEAHRHNYFVQPDSNSDQPYPEGATDKRKDSALAKGRREAVAEAFAHHSHGDDQSTLSEQRREKLASFAKHFPNSVAAVKQHVQDLTAKREQREAAIAANPDRDKKSAGHSHFTGTHEYFRDPEGRLHKAPLQNSVEGSFRKGSTRANESEAANTKQDIQDAESGSGEGRPGQLSGNGANGEGAGRPDGGPATSGGTADAGEGQRVAPEAATQPTSGKDQMLSEVRGFLDGINSGKGSSAEIEAIGERIQKMPKSEIDALLPELKIAGKFGSKKAAADAVKQVLKSQYEMGVKAQEANQPIPSVEIPKQEIEKIAAQPPKEHGPAYDPIAKEGQPPPKDKPVTLVYGGSFSPIHGGHVQGLDNAIKHMEEQGYKVGNVVVAPSADKLLRSKLGGNLVPLTERVAMAKHAFSGRSNVDVTGGPGEEAEGFQGKLKRTQLADWAATKYPGSTVVNVTGQDAVPPGAPKAFPAMFAGGNGSSHEGYYYLGVPRDESDPNNISSGKIRRAIKEGKPLPEGWMHPEAERLYRDHLEKKKDDRSPDYPEQPEPKAGEQQVPEFPGLTPGELEIEAKAREKVLTQYPQMRERYLTDNAVQNPDGSLRSVHINTDEWRQQFEGYNGVNSQAVHEPASYASKKLLSEMMQEQKGKGNNRFAIFAGGSGSGKSTAIGRFFNEDDYPIRLDQISDNYDKTVSKIDEARANGYDPEYVFVDRRPEDAWTNGVVKRAQSAHEKGAVPRTVPLRIALKANIDARKTALKILEKRPDIPPNVLDNRDGKGKRRLLTDRNEAIEYLKSGIADDEKQLNEGLHDRLEAEVSKRHHAGELPEHIAKGLIGHEAFERRKAEHERARIHGSEPVPTDDAARAKPPSAEDARRSEPRRPTGDAGARPPAKPGAAANSVGAGGQTEFTMSPFGRAYELAKGDNPEAARAALSKLSEQEAFQILKKVGKRGDKRYMPESFAGTPTTMSTAHAPAGGITIAGKKFDGGEFVPGDKVEKATPEQKARLEMRKDLFDPDEEETPRVTNTQNSNPLSSIIQVREQIKKLFDEGHDVFIRWSVDPIKDQHKWGGKSKDSVSGKMHDGLSAVKVHPDWLEYSDASLIDRIGEYGFLRSKRSNIKPWIVVGKQLGYDTQLGFIYTPYKNEVEGVDFDLAKDSDGYPVIEVTGNVYPISAKMIDNERAKKKRNRTMKQYEDKTKTVAYQELVKRTCDLCGTESRAGSISEWDGRLFAVDETTIKMEICAKKGENYPDNGHGTEIEIDLCPKCFKEKLIPWLLSQGAKLKEEEWDW